MKSLLHNQSGAMSVLIALAVASVGALLVFQLSSSFQIVNRLQATQKSRAGVTQAMQRLATQLKHAYDLGKIYSNCQSVDGRVNLVRFNLDGTVLCLPHRRVLCVQNTGYGDDLDNACLSLEGEALNWRDTSMGTGGRGRTVATVSREDGNGVRNRINIPSPPTGGDPDTELRKSCRAPAFCVRMVLCGDGDRNCSLQEAKAVQVLRIGRL